MGLQNKSAFHRHEVRKVATRGLSRNEAPIEYRSKCGGAALVSTSCERLVSRRGTHLKEEGCEENCMFIDRVCIARCDLW